MKALYNDPKFIKLSGDKQEFIYNKLLSDIKGRMLEEIVLLNVTRSLSDCFVSQFRFYEYRKSPFKNGEYDMVIRNKKNETFIFEIKHSSEVEYNKQTENGFKVKEKVVLYNGKTLDKDDNGVIYLNASEFLEELKVYDRNYLYNKNGITDGNEDNDAVNISIEDDFEDRDI